MVAKYISWGVDIPFPYLLRKGKMDNKEFNKQRHNRKKQQYRFTLGIQQL